MTTATSAKEIQIRIAYEVLMMDETGKSKKVIADEFGVSPRSVTRYFDKYEDEALALISTEDEPEENTELNEAFSTEAKEEEATEPEEEEQPTEKSLAEEKAEIEEKMDAADGVNQELDAEDLERYDELNEEEESVELKDAEVSGSLDLKDLKKQDFFKELNDKQKKTLEDYFAQKGEMVELQLRKGKRGRPSKGVKSIRFITMEIIESHKAEGTLTKENRNEIVKQIMEATGHNEKQAKKYFSGYKKMFGGWNE